MRKGAKCSMQNSEVVLYNLSKQASKESYPLDRLYRNLYNKDFYIKAYENVVRGKGSNGQQIDYKQISEEKIEAMIALLKNESYQPLNRNMKVNTKKQPYQWDTEKEWQDRLIQEICRMMLDAIYEPTFSAFSHSFREKRNCQTALVQVRQTCKGVKWFIQGEVKDFYTSMDYHILIHILRKKIKDERFIRLMWKFLKAGYLEEWRFNLTYSNTPVGGRLSPILANIYLNELDQYVTNKVLEENREWNMSQPHSHNSKQHKSLHYVRYGAHFLIGIQGSKKDCQQIQSMLGDYLWENLQLEMKEARNTIVHSSKNTAFLGYEITIKPTMTHNVPNHKSGEVQLRIPKRTIERFILDRKMVKDIQAKQWDMLHRTKLLYLKDVEIIQLYNAELRGLYQYYCIAENVSQKMGQLKHVMEYSCLKTLANKYKSTVKKIRTKYRQGKYWGVKIDTGAEEKLILFYNEGFKKRKMNPKRNIDRKPTLKYAKVQSHHVNG